MEWAQYMNGIVKKSIKEVSVIRRIALDRGNYEYNKDRFFGLNLEGKIKNIKGENNTFVNSKFVDFYKYLYSILMKN